MRFRPTENHLQLPSDCEFFEELFRRHQCNGRKFEWISQNVERKFWRESSKMNEITTTEGL
jgi:hypothetical protein